VGISRRVLFCLGVPGLFVGWAAISRFMYEEMFDDTLGLLWWPFAVLGLFSVVLGFLVVRSGGARDVAAGLARRIDEFRDEHALLQTKIDFLTAEREIGMILNDNLERRIVLDRVLEMTANLLRADPDGDLRLFLRNPE
jgi:hypothetical protein